LRDRFFTEVSYPPHASLDDAYTVDNIHGLVIAFRVARPDTTSPPTLQACAYTFAEYIRGLAEVVREKCRRL
jgi:hypothetical protein